MVHMHMDCYSQPQKRMKIPYALVATWMQIEIILREISLKEKDKYHMVSLICGI